MKTIGTLLALGALLAAPASVNATPEMPCKPAGEVAKHLHDKYSEVPVAMALQENGQLLQIYAAPNGATWTAVSTTPAGISCVLSVGKSWLTVPPKSTDPLV